MHGLNNLLTCIPIRVKNLHKDRSDSDVCKPMQLEIFFGLKATAQNMDHLTFRDKQRPSYPGNLVVKMEGGGSCADASLRMAIKASLRHPDADSALISKCVCRCSDG